MLRYLKKKEIEDNPVFEDDPSASIQPLEDVKTAMKTTSSINGKIEDNARIEDNTKLTFRTHHTRTGVMERIKSYENITNENGCVFMNGMCHKHKVSLVRHIKVRKVSVLGDNGEVSWNKNEFAALKCPVATKPRMISSAESDLMMSSDERG